MMQTADSAHPCAINIAGKRPHSHRLWHVHLSIQMGIPTGKVAYLSVMAQATVLHGIITPITIVIYIYIYVQYIIMISPFITPCQLRGGAAQPFCSEETACIASSSTKWMRMHDRISLLNVGPWFS